MTQAELNETALRAIVARVRQEKENESFFPFLDIINPDDESGEVCSLDCEAIARKALGLEQGASQCQ